MSLTFDELLNLAARGADAIPVAVKALGGRTVYVRNPSSRDVDTWRLYASRNQTSGAPMAAKLVQILLCDEAGRPTVPQTDEALERLGDLGPAVIDEIARACLPLVADPTEEALEDEKKG